MVGYGGIFLKERKGQITPCQLKNIPNTKNKGRGGIKIP